MRDLKTSTPQRGGDELDLDAVVRATTERRRGHTTGHKLYQRIEPRHREVAALLLLETSTSTADIAPNDGRTLLDLARDAALLIAMTRERAGDRCAIHGFVRTAATRCATNVSRGSTSRWPVPAWRVWPEFAATCRDAWALLHATRALTAQAHERRVLLLITDGEPHDIDIFDRRYLIEDARHAVFEAARLGVSTFCVKLDATADPYLRLAR